MSVTDPNVPTGGRRRTCKRRLNGKQDSKVALFRKESKKAGQEELVKLLPKLVSKGLGSGTLVGTTEAVIKGEDAVGVEDELAEEALEGFGDDDGMEASEVLAELAGATPEVDNGVAVVDPKRLPSCRGMKRRSRFPMRGTGRVSTSIPPRWAGSPISNSASYLLRPVSASDMPHTVARTSRVKIHVQDTTSQPWTPERRRPGLILCDCSLTNVALKLLLETCKLSASRSCCRQGSSWSSRFETNKSRS